jgi:hypothetical protein
MAKMSLLDIVQDILSDMDSDEVNSINDTTESLQVAQIVKTTYYNILDGRDYPWMHELFQIDSSATPSRPTHMKMPETIIDLDWIKYNCKKATDNKNIFKKITYKLPEEFMDIVDQRSSDDSKIVVINDPTGIKLNIYNDRAPQYFTSFDDEYLIFDAYDSAIENNLQSIKTQCFGKRATTFTLDDNFVPDMPVQMFSYLLNEAKSTAFLVLKQMPNQKAEQVSVSQKRRMSQEAWRLKNGISYPNYGRK